MTLIQLLKQVPGAVSYDGDVSTQVVLYLKDGSHIRIGITDNDVAETPGLWFDRYEGFNNELNGRLSK
jgi:hypothetical protein